MAERPWKFESSRPHHFGKFRETSGLAGVGELIAIASQSRLSPESRARRLFNHRVEGNFLCRNDPDGAHSGDRRLAADLGSGVESRADLGDPCGFGRKADGIPPIGNALEQEEAVEIRPGRRHDLAGLIEQFDIQPLFEAAAEAVEEAVINALFMATDMDGVDDHRVYALPIPRTLDIMRAHRRLFAPAGESRANVTA